MLKKNGRGLIDMKRRNFSGGLSKNRETAERIWVSWLIIEKGFPRRKPETLTQEQT
jgi:hypothetical protein